MKKYLILCAIFAAIGGYCSNAPAKEVAGGIGIRIVEEPEPYGYYYYNYPAWTGPGYYYGVWFADEMAFHGWYRGHYRGHRGGHHGGHGGGGHHGGHGGGGHHGGHGGGRHGGGRR